MQENERQRSHNFVNDFVFSVLKLLFFSEKKDEFNFVRFFNNDNEIYQT